MPDASRLLTLPTEIRWHIYSFIYLEHLVVDFLRPKSHYSKTALFLACRQLNQETLGFYYGRNTFSLPLSQRFAMSDWSYMPRNFELVKTLHLEANTFFWKSSSNRAKTSEHIKNCQRRLEKYLSAILWANRGSIVPGLKTLIFADRLPTIHDKEHWDHSTDTSKKRLDEYIQIFEELGIAVGQVVINIK